MKMEHPAAAAIPAGPLKNGQDRPRVKAIVREGGVIYTNVEVHLKGSAGSFRSVDDNPGLTLNFEKSAPGQTFHGYRKISLNNSVQDKSFLISTSIGPIKLLLHHHTRPNRLQ